MVGLELLQRRQGTVSRFRELEAPALEHVRLADDVPGGLGLAEERESDGDDGRDGEERGEDERCRHTGGVDPTGLAASA